MLKVGAVEDEVGGGFTCRLKEYWAKSAVY